MIKGILSNYLLKAVLIGLTALILYGVFSATSLAIILMLFVGWRFTSLGAEALRKPVSAEQLERMVGALTENYEKLPAEKRVETMSRIKQDGRRGSFDSPLPERLLDQAKMEFPADTHFHSVETDPASETGP
jgi:hypothetical protein